MLSLLMVFLAVLAPVPQDGAQSYRENCARCHGSEGSGVPGVDFRGGRFRRASTDDDLDRIITTGIPGTAMSPSNMPAASRRLLVGFIRSLKNVAAGAPGPADTTKGRLLFEGKGQCVSCHRVDGKGSRVGPDLSDVGLARRVSDIELSLLDPNASVLVQNRFVRAVGSDGVTISGRRLNEDTDTIQLIDDRERLVSLTKSTLREFTLLKTSPMPSFQGRLTPQELADLVAYLVSLKGARPQ